MSLAAKEMAKPPSSIRHAFAALFSQFVLGITYVVVAINYGEGASVSKALLLATWLMHFVSCLLVGLAAKQMGRRWWRYMSWQIGIPFGGPLMSLFYLRQWRDSRP